MNPLDELFKDIKKELWLEDQAKKRAHSQGRVHVPPSQSTYANPQNWTLGRVIELVHANEGSLGCFQEYFHKLSPTARRLLPAAVGLLPICQELVWGDFWLHPKFQAPHEVESEAEIRAIQLRFQELMDNYAEGVWDEEAPLDTNVTKEDGLTWLGRRS
jgi:hypothetical protein